jgi:acetate kinase
MSLLTINAGSSSLRLAIYETETAPAVTKTRCAMKCSSLLFALR